MTRFRRIHLLPSEEIVSFSICEINTLSLLGHIRYSGPNIANVQYIIPVLLFEPILNADENGSLRFEISILLP